MASPMNVVIAMETVGRSQQGLPVPPQRSAIDGPGGEVLCGCPCDVHESYGMLEACRHTAEQFVKFTISMTGSLEWAGTPQGPTCQACAQAVRAVLKREYGLRLRQLSGE